jgi:hypothetical protein
MNYLYLIAIIIFLLILYFILNYLLSQKETITLYDIIGKKAVINIADINPKITLNNAELVKKGINSISSLYINNTNPYSFKIDIYTDFINQNLDKSFEISGKNNTFRFGELSDGNKYKSITITKL